MILFFNSYDASIVASFFILVEPSEDHELILLGKVTQAIGIELETSIKGIFTYSSNLSKLKD